MNTVLISVVINIFHTTAIIKIVPYCWVMKSSPPLPAYDTDLLPVSCFFAGLCRTSGGNNIRVAFGHLLSCLFLDLHTWVQVAQDSSWSWVCLFEVARSQHTSIRYASISLGEFTGGVWVSYQHGCLQGCENGWRLSVLGRGVCHVMLFSRVHTCGIYTLIHHSGGLRGTSMENWQL